MGKSPGKLIKKLHLMMRMLDIWAEKRIPVLIPGYLGVREEAPSSPYRSSGKRDSIP